MTQHGHMTEPTWTSWRESLGFLRGCTAVPAALANATTLVIARARWESHLVCRTSMHDLLFTRPGDEFPFEASVRVRVDGKTQVVELQVEGRRAQHRCTLDDIDEILGEALAALARPKRVCRACGEVVATPQFEVFERMHYVCFHLEFEHRGADRDETCSVPGCPVTPG